MSDIKDALRSVIQNLIKDDEAAATAAFHPVLTTKMREISGVGSQQARETVEDDIHIGDDIHSGNDVEIAGDDE